MIVGRMTENHEIESHCSGRYIIVNSGIHATSPQLHALAIMNNNFAFDNSLSKNAHDNRPTKTHKKWLPYVPQNHEETNYEMHKIYADFLADDLTDPDPFPHVKL